MSRWWRAEVGIFLVLWGLLLVSLRTHPFSDPGALWHIKVGESILAHQDFMRTDPFTYTFAGQAWLPQQWLAECGMAILHDVGGLDLMHLAMVTGLAVCFAWISRRLLEAGLGVPLAVGITCMGMYVAAYHFFMRPHLWTMVFLAWTVGCLVDFERGRVGLARLAGLIPLCILWTNLHGGVLAGIATFGLALGGWTLWRLLGWDSPVSRPQRFAAITLILLGCGLTILVNPFGLDLLRVWWSIVGSPVLPRVVPEHSPLTLERTGDQVVLALGAFYLLMLAGTWGQRPRVNWLLPLVWFALSVKSIRQGPLFCMVALVCLADLLPATFWYRWLRRSGDTLIQPEAMVKAGRPWSWRWLVLPVATVGVALTLKLTGVAVPVIGAGWAGLDPKQVPIEMNDAVQAYARSQSPGTPIFNDANFGGYLIYHAPNLRIFMDDRCELYRDAWLEWYVESMEQHPERIDQWREQYGFERALVAVDSPMEQYLRDQGWQEVASSTPAVLLAAPE